MASLMRSAARLQPVARQSIRSFQTTAVRSNASAYFTNEPSGPTIKTQIPGPKSQEAIKELDEVFDTRALNMLADYTKSVGN